MQAPDFARTSAPPLATSSARWSLPVAAAANPRPTINTKNDSNSDVKPMLTFYCAARRYLWTAPACGDIANTFAKTAASFAEVSCGVGKTAVNALRSAGFELAWWDSRAETHHEIRGLQSTTTAACCEASCCRFDPSQPIRKEIPWRRSPHRTST